MTVCYDRAVFHSSIVLWLRLGKHNFCSGGFYQVTGEGHWHVLLRARAIELAVSSSRQRRQEHMLVAEKPTVIR